MRIAATADLHFTPARFSTLHDQLNKVRDEADVFVLAGDLTNFGRPDEMEPLLNVLVRLRVPIIAVLGNHDFEAGQEREIAQVLTDVGFHVLDGDTWEFPGVGFAGVRGFCGGFGRGALGPWGEKIIKDFVHEAVQEALKLESALARLSSDHRIVLLHYSPIRTTVEGEPPEIFPFLGSSRLEEPLSRFDVKGLGINEPLVRTPATAEQRAENMRGEMLVIAAESELPAEFGTEDLK
jgi:Icc-related predicted phosphoesterase